MDVSETTSASALRRSRFCFTKSHRLTLPTSSSPSIITFTLMGSLPAVLQQRFERLDVDVHLAFVVGGAAAEEIAVADGGLESGSGPKIERLGGLHVIVAVEKDGGLAGRVQRFAVDQGMHFRGHDFDVFEARGAELFRDPMRGALDVGLVFALGADAGNAQEFFQFVQMSVALRLDVAR